MAAKSKTKAPAEEATPAEDTFLSYNRVQLAGRLTADPDLRYTPSGKAVCRLRVATNDTREAQFHDVVAWEQDAETAAETLTKGSRGHRRGPAADPHLGGRRRLQAPRDGDRRQLGDRGIAVRTSRAAHPGGPLRDKRTLT